MDYREKYSREWEIEKVVSAVVGENIFFIGAEADGEYAKAVVCTILQQYLDQKSHSFQNTPEAVKHNLRTIVTEMIDFYSEKENISEGQQQVADKVKDFLTYKMDTIVDMAFDCLERLSRARDSSPQNSSWTR